MRNLSARNRQLPEVHHTQSTRKTEARELSAAFLAGLLLATVLAISASAVDTGKFAVYPSSGSSPVPGNLVVLDATQFSGGDMCTKIYNAWVQLGSATSGVIDARGFSGVKSCLIDPFPQTCSVSCPTGTYAGGGVLLLGPAEIHTQASWIIPTRVTVQGIGQSATGSGVTNTLLQAVSGFSDPNSANALVYMGNRTSTQSMNVRLRGMSLDCNAICDVGVLNDISQEGSTVEDVIIANAKTYGLKVTTVAVGGVHGAANSGPYRNITVQYNSCSACTTPVGVEIDGDNSGVNLRQFEDITADASGINAGVGFNIDGASCRITDSHTEHYGTGIVIGASQATHNVAVENVSIFAANGTDILLTRTGDIYLAGINDLTGSSATVVNDQITSHTLPGTTNPYIALYAVGHGSPTRIVSTSPTVATGMRTKGKQGTGDDADEE